MCFLHVYFFINHFIPINNIVGAIFGVVNIWKRKLQEKHFLNVHVADKYNVVYLSPYTLWFTGLAKANFGSTIGLTWVLVCLILTVLVLHLLLFVIVLISAMGCWHYRQQQWAKLVVLQSRFYSEHHKCWWWPSSCCQGVNAVCLHALHYIHVAKIIVYELNFVKDSAHVFMSIWSHKSVIV